MKSLPLAKSTPAHFLMTEPGVMIQPFSKHPNQSVDHEQTANVLHAALDPGDRHARVNIQPFPVWALVVLGLVTFLVGFFSGRYGSNITSPRLSLTGAPQPPANEQTVRADANSASAVHGAIEDVNAPEVVQVVIRNMKFNPPTVEVKSGDVVEWKNDDITPHTATSPIFDSASIQPDETWRHTFTAPGSFSYSCTFHPDMKAVLIVK